MMKKPWWKSLFVIMMAVTLMGVVPTESIAKKVEMTLYATDGFTTMPDGKQVYIWGFTDDPKGQAQVPAPPIIVDEGDDVYVTLINKMMLQAIPPNHEPHTIHLHGIEVPTEFDGVPELSFPVGARYTYFFKAEKAGTYMYHCHVQAPKHIHMGMYGALIIRPKLGKQFAYNNDSTKFDKEYTYVLNEIDTRWNDKIYNGGGAEINHAEFEPNYWLINGKAFPDTLKDERTRINARVGENILLRLINMGSESHPIHLHGTFMKIIAKDANMLSDPQSVYTVNIAPGEAYDIMVNFKDLRKVSPVYKKAMRYPQKYIIHDHGEFRITNNGKFTGGMMSFIYLDKPKDDDD